MSRAGKTSLYLFEAPDVPRVNGDTLLQQGHSPEAVEAALRQQLQELIDQQASFVIETNAATGRDYALFNSLKQSGYRLELRYVCLESVALCQARVAQRVREGGHDIPAAIIEQRYANSLSLLKQHYRDVDRLQLYDNTSLPVQLLDFEVSTGAVASPDLPPWAASVCAHITRMEAVYRRMA